MHDGNTFAFFFVSFRNPHIGGHTCITYDAVNQAYLDARKRIRKLKRFYLVFKVIYQEKLCVEMRNVYHLLMQKF